jgi:hypothetical protein
LQDDDVVDGGLEEEDGAAATEVEIDVDELDGVVVGGVQPTPNPKSPAHEELVDDVDVEGLKLVMGAPVPVDETVALLDAGGTGALIPSPLPTPPNTLPKNQLLGYH